LGRSPGAPRTISNQLLRSGTSIGANVEEAQAAQSRKDFVCKNSIALKEARETRYWLRALIASEVMTEEPLPSLLRESDELCRILGAIVVKAKANTETS
jgi:four helix bundle protein